MKVMVTGKIIDGEIIIGNGPKLYATEINAKEASTGRMANWAGPYVRSISPQVAQDWCDKNIGYLKVIPDNLVEMGSVGSDGKGKPIWNFEYENN